MLNISLTLYSYALELIEVRTVSELVLTLYKRGFNGYTISMQLLTKTVDT